MDKILDWITTNIENNGLSAVFIGSIIEEIIAPIPSPVVMMGAGFVLLQEYTALSLGLITEMGSIALIGALGALIGSYVMYLLGFFGGQTVIEKTQKFTGVKWSKIKEFQQKLENNPRDEMAIILLRSIPIMPSVAIALTCGVLKIPLLKYSICFYLGGVIRNIIFLVLGWRLGEAFEAAANGFESAQSILTFSIGILVVGFLGMLYWKKRKSEKQF